MPPAGPGEPLHGAQLPRAARDGEQLYLIDTDGSRWRVYDVAFGPPLAAPFKRRRLALGDPRATYRWFIAAGGLQCCYQWPGAGPANRSLEASTLAQQRWVAVGVATVASTSPDRQRVHGFCRVRGDMAAHLPAPSKSLLSTSARSMGHHYVPQKYLSGFHAVGAPDMIWMYDRRDRRWTCPAIAKAAQERGYYTPEHEAALAAQVERPAHRVLDAIRARQLLTAADRSHLATYMATMLMRVPRRRRVARARYPAVRNAVLRDARPTLEQWARQGATDAQVRERIAVVEGLPDTFADQSPEAEAYLRSPWPSARILAQVGAMTWRILAAGTGRMFITSDNPAYFFAAYGLARTESELTFPLSSDLALIASNQGTPGTTLYGHASAPHLKEVNRRMASGAERFVFAPRPDRWIATLADRRDPTLGRIVW